MVGYLLSFFYFKKVALDELAAATGRPGIKFFADSGAYSAHTTGEPVVLDDYAVWVKRWEHLLDPYVNLDVKFNSEAGQANQAHLERLGLTPAPVFHLGEPLDLLREMVERHDFVAVGNITGESRRDPKLWAALDQIHGIAAEANTGLHGFGVGHWPIIRRWPWRSVDSSSMGASFRYGVAHLFNPYEDRWVKFRTRETATWHRWGWLLREYGFEPGEFAGRSRKEQLIPLFRLAGATWARAAQAKPETDFYLVDLGFPQVYEDHPRITYYERGVQMVEAVAA